MNNKLKFLVRLGNCCKDLRKHGFNTINKALTQPRKRQKRYCKVRTDNRRNEDKNYSEL